MSMLRSAAMTLLSKTLLTFLYKYLSDVDVEGVEMPSLYGGSEGSGSGWGVRLSNVKLKEGAELMQLPGGRKAKKKKKKQPKQNGKNDDASFSHSTGGPDMSKDDTEKNGGNSSSEREDEEVRSTSPQTPENKISSWNKDHEPLEILDKHLADTGRSNSMPAISNTVTTAQETDCESLGSLEGGTRPETPVQESSFNLLSCFAPGTDAKKGEKGMPALPAQDKNIVSKVNYEYEDCYEEQHYENGKKLYPTMEENDSDNEGQDSFHETDHAKAVYHSIHTDENAKELASDYEAEVGDENDSSDLEEEKTPMVLRIGEGGYIGTLDVRLVGRELHVLVEDAFLTLEAVTKGGVADEEAAAKVAAERQASTSEPNPLDLVDKKPPATAKPSTAKPSTAKEFKTTGERVLAQNAIARIFSSIPHLFLRDIRVRLVVRDDSDSSKQKQNDDTDQDDITSEEEFGGEFDNADVVVDVGIELLSVTEGEDFLSPFHTDDTSIYNGEQKQMIDSPSAIKLQKSAQSDSSPDNHYLERRIRTGKGSDGGIWINVVTPKVDQSPSFRKIPQHIAHPQDGIWARNAWLESTRYCVFRCSGLDIQCRIFLGTRKELGQSNASYLWAFDDSDSYQGIDHTLYGFDHVVPGPTPRTLPPLAPPGPIGSATRSIEEEDENGHLYSQMYRMDTNGIQSSKVGSCFHRVARGMTPTRCTVEHLPCENCSKCWEVGTAESEGVIAENHSLDLYTPLPGLALSISIRDLLELNADRLALDGLGLVIDLFGKKAIDKDISHRSEDETVDNEKFQRETVEEKEAENSDAGVAQSRFSSFFFGAKKTEGLLSRRGKNGEAPPAFPSYMKPETLQILGVYVAKINFRVHVMQPLDEKRHNSGLSFCYWDMEADCLTLDYQKLDAQEKKFVDMRFDAALFEIKEFKGIERKTIIASGVPVPHSATDCVSSMPLKINSNNSRSPWPSTACALLGIPPAFDSLIHEARERHGIQLRYLHVIHKPETATEKIRTLVNAQIGTSEVDMPWPIKQTIVDIRDEAKRSLLGTVPEDSNSDYTDQEQDKVLQYRAQLDGGRVRLEPLIDVRLPLTRLAGDICPESGFSVETLLEHVDLSFGQSTNKIFPTANSGKGVSLRKMPTLPEKVRLRILLFIDDLEPLEKALGIKSHASPFLRCNEVNKGLSRLAAKKTDKKKAHSSKKVDPESTKKLSRRQELINKLLTLDDDALERLWTTHHKKKKKAKKVVANTT